MFYRPDTFEKLYHQYGGPALWDFLQTDDCRLRMEVATYLGRPAVEPLSPVLMQRFGGQVALPPIRRMVGHMVRQIMESRGFRLDRSGVVIRRAGNIFYSGSRYRPS